MGNQDDDMLLTLTVDIVVAHVGNNSVPLNELPQLIASVHRSLATLGSAPVPPEVRAAPSVPLRSSIKPDYIVCLEDGKRMKTLKRHLKTHHDMSPDEYRKKWGLDSNYPMVSPNYADQRRALAKSFGLGIKRRKTLKIK